MLEHVEDLGAHSLKELVVTKDVRCTQGANFVGEFLARLGQHISFEASVHVVLDVVRVRLRNLHVHFDVVLVIWVLFLVRMQQVFVLLKIFDYLAVDADVLQRPVNDYENLHIDGPVVQVRDVSFQDKLERSDRRDLLLMLAVKSLEQD